MNKPGRMWSNEDQLAPTYEGKWRMTDLLGAIRARGLKPEKFDLKYFSWSDYDFGGQDLWSWGQHLTHVLESDTEEPIIVNHVNRVIDGRHRIMKAVMIEGKTSLMCYRLPTDMNPTEVVK